MYSVDIMMEEHKNILRMLTIVKKSCCQVLEGGEFIIEDQRAMIDFVREYADKHHHGKEEDFLFPEMVKRMGPVADNLITHGMLVEHNMGRAHVLGWETALNEYEKSPTTDFKLDILTEAMAYAHLLRIHIEKEDSVVYTIAMRELPEEVKNEIDELSREFEGRQEGAGFQKKYLTFLEAMEKKYQLA